VKDGESVRFCRLCKGKPTWCTTYS